ncbi:universal stress protein [Erythrobacter crassostreae]|uniref:Universal stress protein n=1 Tax=Erythrobacter crassostreae TaxID=2828328 RepID=A0A9X1F636_9SPHN|nr:universal stress protein [Erythrobacter crassostrea]MBV7259505.1 universal stress protein [Erythrobacter crassostrea]
MKSILVHAADDSAMESRMQVALDIARATGAHITFLQSVSYEVFAPGDFYGSAMAAALPQIKQAAEDFRSKTEADLANEDAVWEWKFLYGMAEARLLEQSALHDLIIVGPHDIGEGGKRPSRMAGELALKAPVPVLVVPDQAKRFDLSAPVLVAWNGSSEAGVALRAAVPLLKYASDVFLACVSEEKSRERSDFRLDEGAKYLSRHGVEAEIIEIPRDKQKVADTLFAAAETRGCSMMVMGAYGHSRLAELLLGGVTRRSLTDPRLPIFLAH